MVYDDVLRRLVTGPDGWVLPALSVGYHNGELVSEAHVATLLAEDLACAWTPDGAARRLIERGEFLLAEDLINEFETARAVPDATTNALRAALVAAQESATDHVTGWFRRLVARYDRAGVDVPAPLRNQLSITERLAPALAALGEADDDIAGKEGELGRTLNDGLDSVGGPLPPEWVAHVRELIADGQYRMARGALAQPSPNGVALPVRQIGKPWPLGYSIARAARDLASPEHRPHALRHFVPAADDTAGRRLVDSLGDLTTGSPDGIARYVNAVQRLVVDVDVDPRIEERDGIRYAWLLLPFEQRLPRLSFADNDPVAFAIGAEFGDAAYRLSLQLTEPPLRAGVVIDVASVLSLLSRDEHERSLTMSSRRVAFLRIICRQLDVRTLVAAADLAALDSDGLRARVWWLLYLLGFTVTAVELDELLELSGGHAEAVLSMISAAKDDADRANTARLDLDLVRRRMDLDSIGAVVRAEVGTAAFAILLVLAGLDATTERDLREGIAMLTDPAGDRAIGAVVSDALDVEAALRELRQRRYLPNWSAGNDDLTLCGCGVVRCLERSAAAATEAHALFRQEAEQRRQRLERLAQARLRERVLEDVRHAWAGRDSDPQHVRRAGNRALDLGQLVDVSRQCELVWRRVRTREDRVDVLFDGARGASCRGAPLVLQLAVENLMHNAIEAAGRGLSSDGEDSGTVDLAVSLVDGTVVVDICDSGPGIPASVRDSFDRDEPPLSTEHAGTGEGLACAKYLVSEMDGLLELLPGPAPVLGGAHVRITLPACAG
jgi:signal transduction histidine kinase